MSKKYKYFKCIEKGIVSYVIKVDADTEYASQNIVEISEGEYLALLDDNDLI